jgi:hypothetical protein
MIPHKLTPPLLRQLLATIGGWEHASVLDRAFAFTSVAAVGFDSPRLEEIPCDCVVSHIWKKSRFNDVLDAHDEGIELPPIWVTAVTWAGTKFFILTDGNHRTEGAKARNRTHIKGYVTDAQICQPADFTIVGRSLLNGDVTHTRGLTANEIRVLRALGAHYHWNPLRWIADTVFTAREDRAMMARLPSRRTSDQRQLRPSSALSQEYRYLLSEKES